MTVCGEEFTYGHSEWFGGVSYTVTCTEDAGHEGDHTVEKNGRVVIRWERKEDDAASSESADGDG